MKSTVGMMLAWQEINKSLKKKDDGNSATFSRAWQVVFLLTVGNSLQSPPYEGIKFQ